MRKANDITIDGSVAYISLNGGWKAVVDIDDLPIISDKRWTARVERRKDGSIRCIYAFSNVVTESGKKTSILMHRLITGADAAMCVDHQDGNGLRNTRRNLRVVTRGQNSMNQRAHTDSGSGFKGVCFMKKTDRWHASIYVDKKQKHLGDFERVVDAARAYDAAARELYGEHAALNFPKSGERSARSSPAYKLY